MYNFTILIFCCIIILTCICVLLFVTNTNMVEILTDGELFKMLMSNFFVNKINCETETTYCFSDAECNTKCTTSNKCMHGICKIETGYIDYGDACDPKMGMLAYLVGNPSFGIYNWICKSVDSGIAISNVENRMCFNGSMGYDYTRHYPSITSCVCDDKITIPATREKRKHVECNSIYADLIEY